MGTRKIKTRNRTSHCFEKLGICSDGIGGILQKQQGIIRGTCTILSLALNTSASLCQNCDFQKCKLAEPQTPQSNPSHQFLSSVIPSTRGQSIRHERLPAQYLRSVAEFDSV